MCSILYVHNYLFSILTLITLYYLLYLWIVVISYMNLVNTHIYMRTIIPISISTIFSLYVLYTLYCYREIFNILRILYSISCVIIMDIFIVYPPHKGIFINHIYRYNYHIYTRVPFAGYDLLCSICLFITTLTCYIPIYIQYSFLLFRNVYFITRIFVMNLFGFVSCWCMLYNL